MSGDSDGSQGIVKSTISEMTQKANDAVRIFADIGELDSTNHSKEKSKAKGKAKGKDKDKDKLPMRWCGGAPAEMLPWSPQSLTAQDIHVISLQPFFKKCLYPVQVNACREKKRERERKKSALLFLFFF